MENLNAVTPVGPTEGWTGRLIAPDLTGDSQVHWNRFKEDEVAVARQSYDALKKKGYRAFKLGKDGSTGEQIFDFDPKHERILMLPQMAGG